MVTIVSDMKARLCIKPSKLDGKGLFTNIAFNKGQTIFYVSGKIVEIIITDLNKASQSDWNWFGYGKNTWIETANDFSKYFNHSCNPNTGIVGKRRIVALKDIAKDEELTFDYSTNEADVFWSITCECGNPGCRKVIRSIQFMPEEIYLSYLPYIPKFYREVYEKFRITKFKNERELKENWIKFLQS